MKTRNQRISMELDDYLRMQSKKNKTSIPNISREVALFMKRNSNRKIIRKKIIEEVIL